MLERMTVCMAFLTFTSTTSLKFTVPRSGPITVNAWSDQALTVIGPNVGNGKFLSEFVVW